MAVSSYRFEEPSGARVVAFPTAEVRRRRLARRRGIALRRTGAGAALAATLALVLLGSGGGTAQAVHSDVPRAVVLRSGQTVWDLARRYAPESIDPRAYVDEVITLNHLSGAPAAGQRIRLP